MSKSLKQKNNNRKLLSLLNGFTLVETLVAISIFTVSILGLMSVLSSGISSTIYAKQKMAASYLAQEGIEYIRNIRDTDVLYMGGGDWFSFNVALDSLNFFPSSDVSFTRRIQKIPVLGNSDEIKIISEVSWRQGSGSYSITFSENLFNWFQ